MYLYIYIYIYLWIIRVGAVSHIHVYDVCDVRDVGVMYMMHVIYNIYIYIYIYILYPCYAISAWSMWRTYDCILYHNTQSRFLVFYRTAFFVGGRPPESQLLLSMIAARRLAPWKE